MESPTDTLIPLLKLIEDGIQNRINRRLAGFGITFSQIRVLMLLNRPEKDVYSMKELEKIFQVSQQTMAGIVSRLEQKGYLTGFTDPNDKRVKLVKTTEEGRILALDAMEEMWKSEQEIEQFLTEAERNALLPLLQKLYQKLQ